MLLPSEQPSVALTPVVKDPPDATILMGEDNFDPDRLGLAPAHPGSGTPWQRWLALSRERLLAVLPQLVGLGQVVFVDSEIWSPRKMLRRALWHERDHLQHLRRFRQVLGVD